jgi:zinc/manganese transport system substrate-binding protein
MKNILKLLTLLGGWLAMQPALAALNVMACEPEWGALSRELGGDKVSIYVATTALQDPHHIEARPSLIARARSADLMVCTGAELEVGWMPLLQTQSGNPKIQLGQPGYFEAAPNVLMLEIPARLDRSMGDVHPQGNPHVHMDPRNVAKIAAALSERSSLLTMLPTASSTSSPAAWPYRSLMSLNWSTSNRQSDTGE